jgi:xanthine dehydrogenase YagT iron-sulfur-binding subunit
MSAVFTATGERHRLSRPDNRVQLTEVVLSERNSSIDRRDVMTLGIAAGVAPTAFTKAGAQLPKAPEQNIDLALNVNGKLYRLEADIRTTLLDALREHFSLTGTKKGCDHGQCGACTVHADGRRILACLTLARQCAGRKITTIEGIAGTNGALHPVQQAFLDNDGLQCGYCTPGQIMSAIACINEGHIGSADEIREYMSGNLCRCGAYVGILAAIQAAAVRRRA